jgi:hypothetical protein
MCGKETVRVWFNGGEKITILKRIHSKERKLIINVNGVLYEL